ncbi:hypothetical protein PS928_02121 [Pseudomonas fluorescens]|jgi:hypothetical protein|uniref:Uncharacterized protein n=1 Tax=Pseudomonas fluorescens TaxID=294 RepID=A0A5E7TDJ4_PSEFL|nr:hypothetical protein PS928_02121 [Pseudomonas fluorescens]
MCASLLAKAVGQSASVLNVPPSLASQLLQGVCVLPVDLVFGRIEAQHLHRQGRRRQ